MKLFQWIGCALLLGLLLSVPARAAEGWQASYEAAISAAKKGEWAEAKELFLKAAEDRSDDTDKGIRVSAAPGVVNLWRDGAPYTPHFGAGYSTYKIALQMDEGDERSATLKEASSYYALVRASQSPSAMLFYYESKVHEAMGMNAAAQSALNQMAMTKGGLKLDTEFVTKADKDDFKTAQKLAANTPVLPADASGESGGDDTASLDTPTTTPSSTDTPTITSPSNNAANPSDIDSQPSDDMSEPVEPETPSDEPAMQPDKPDQPEQPAVEDNPSEDNGDENNEEEKQPVIGQFREPKPKPKAPKVDKAPEPEDPAPLVGAFRKTKPREQTDSGNSGSSMRREGNGPPFEEIDTATGTKVRGTAQSNPNNTSTDRIAIDPSKYAILIGNSGYDTRVGLVPHATTDAQTLATALRERGGYQEDHITLVLDKSKEELLSEVRRIGNSLPDDCVVFVFFAGKGAFNASENRDYLFGTDATDMNDWDAAISKRDLLLPFAEAAQRVISVWEVDRVPASEGERAFGQEVPSLPGVIAIWNACSSGQRCYAGQLSGGQFAGVFTLELERELRADPDGSFNVTSIANRISSSVNKRALQASLGEAGGSTGQNPPLPVFNQPGSDEQANF